MKKVISLTLCVFLILSSFAGCKKSEGAEQVKGSSSGATMVEMSIKGYGKVKIELYPEEAPITVDNFLSLVESGFYDGITFHRLDKDFVLQGGDPDGDGYGGTDNPIKGEFASNGVQNNIKHKRGVISMARTGDPNSATSQFFICLDDRTAGALDGNYAAFGCIIEGMDVIDNVRDTTPESDHLPASLQPVIEYIKVIN